MPTRTWLTTPPGEEPVADQREHLESERYVPGLREPREPRVPGRHRRTVVAVLGVVVVLLLVVTLVVVGERAQQEDPSVPDIPGIEDPTMGPPEADEDDAAAE